MRLELITLPLSVMQEGEIRITGSRIPLQFLVYEYCNGATAEDIVVHYPSLRLADVHATLSYYLNHKAEVDKYVLEQEKLADDLREKIEQRFPQNGLRQRLLARLGKN